MWLSRWTQPVRAPRRARCVPSPPTGVTPTETGLAFFREAQLALRHADEAARAAQQSRLSGSVSVGLAPTTASVLGLPLMQAVRERYPASACTWSKACPATCRPCSTPANWTWPSSSTTSSRGRHWQRVTLAECARGLVEAGGWQGARWSHHEA